MTDPEPGDQDDDGSQLVLVRIGLAYGDRLATWDAGGTSLIWRVPDELVDLVGRASLPRAELGGGLSGEVVVVDQVGSTIRGADDREWPAILLTEAAGPADNATFAARLGRIVAEAAGRGESVVLAAGGLREFAPPAARASVIRDHDGSWAAVVEAFPPLTIGPWAEAEQEESLARLTLPADERGLHEATLLLLTAASTFTRGPELVGLYFETAHDGPWTG